VPLVSVHIEVSIAKEKYGKSQSGGYTDFERWVCGRPLRWSCAARTSWSCILCQIRRLSGLAEALSFTPDT